MLAVARFPTTFLRRYSAHIKAVAVHLTHHPMMPIARTGSLTGDLFGLPLSEATVLAAVAEAPLPPARKVGPLPA